eukprot:superscaffoldBa00005823_g20824
MASTPLLLLPLLLVSLASASHYFGGTVTFSYKGRNPDGTFKVDVRNRATFDGCQNSHSWSCYSGNCGYDVKRTECSRCNQPSGFHLDQGSCTLHYRYANANPRVFGFELVVEDFPRRPITLAYTDGSRSSRSPLAARRKRRAATRRPPTTAPPPWWWQTAIPATTAPPPAATTGVPYPNTPPLSKLPLQFSLLVDPPAPSCQEGEYLPRFVNPTPQNGERIHAEVNKEVEIRVKAQARYSTLHDIIISGPMNISKHRTTHDEFVIRWTPIPEDLGDHYAICFAVESFTGSAVTASQSSVTGHHHHHPTPTSQSGIYQSEMRCKVDESVEIHSTDHEKQFRFSMEAFKFIGLHDQVYISCSVLMCEAGNPNTRCSRGCDNSTQSGGHHHHRKREAVVQSASHFVSQGPLRLRRSAESTENT